MKNPLVELIYNYINGKELCNCSDYSQLLFATKKHSLGTLFYLAVKDSEKVAPEIKNQALKHYLSQINQQASQDYYVEKLFAKLKDANLRFLPLKGGAIRNLYPSPELRTSCDVDFFYDEKDKKQVYSILTELGFQKGHETVNHCEWQSGVVTIESHHALVTEGGPYADYYKDVWSRLESKDGCQYQFSKEDLYIYCIVHSAKHFASGGFGVRTVLDFYFFNSKNDFNQEYLSRELDKLGLKEYERVIKNLANYWFGGEEANQDVCDVGKYVLDSGVYGNSDNFAVIKGGEKDLKSTKKKFWLKTIFPSYKTMKGKYKILKKLPFLLPFAWVYKWFEVLFTRPAKFKRTIENSDNLSQEKIDFTNKIMKITKIKKS